MDAEIRKWAEGLAREAFIQGWLTGEARGRGQTIEHGRRAQLLTERDIRQEYDFAPISGNEMDGFSPPAERGRTGEG